MKLRVRFSRIDRRRRVLSGVSIRLMLSVLLITPAFAADEFEIARSVSASRHAELATRLQEAGKIVEALREWRIVDAVVPGSDHVEKQIESLSKQIHQRSRSLLVDAQAAFDNRDNERATRLLLAVLSYDSRNAVAQHTLAVIESAKSMEYLNAQAPNATAAAIPPANTKPITPVEFLPIVKKKPTSQAPKPARSEAKKTNAKIRKSPRNDSKLGSKPKVNTTIEKTAVEIKKRSKGNHALANDPDHYSRLAERHFQNGLKLFLNNRTAAITEFEMSLRLNPKHALARQYRARALGLIDK